MCLPKGSLSSICGAGPLRDTVTSRRLGSKGTSHLFSWALSWLEDSRWTFMAWTVSSTHFKTWREEKNAFREPYQRNAGGTLDPSNYQGPSLNLERQDKDKKGQDCSLSLKAPTNPFPARAACCSLSSDYSFIAKVFLRGILPKQRKSETAQLSNW